MIIDFVPQSGTVVQVDCATAWATLSREADVENSDLKKLNIKIDLGRHHNRNKNPVSDNACKEFHKEVLRLKPEGTVLTETERAVITSNINQRIRRSGYSSKEICFKRDLVLNTNKDIDDKVIAGDIIESREKYHNEPNNFNFPNISIGLNVFLKSDKSKLKARQLYRIVDVYFKDKEKWVTIQKHDTQFRAKKYQVKAAEIIPLPGQAVSVSESDLDNRSRPLRKSAEKARELFSKLSSVYLSPKSPPSHGWDYEKMLEMFEAEDDTSFYSSPVPPQDNDNDHDTSSDSPTNDSSDTSFEDANENQSSSSTLSAGSRSDDQGPPLPARLPTNLNNVHNLADQLDIPEVHAAAIQGIIDSARDFNRQHPRPPPVPEQVLRKSTRNVSKPANYATFSRTGKK